DLIHMGSCIIKFAHFQQSLANGVAVLFAHSYQQHHDFFLKFRAEFSHHTQIHKSHPVIRSKMDIARMWISMRETVYNNLLEIGFYKVIDEWVEIHFSSDEFSERSYFFAFNEIHRQDFGR